jgi:hypothetical protein
MNVRDPFMLCGMCQTEWPTLTEFLNDPQLIMNGYQACFTDSTAGLFVFTHYQHDCNSSLAIPVREFEHLYAGQRHANCKAGGPGCQLHCLDRTNLSSCPNNCSMAWVRILLHELQLSHPAPATLETIE